MLTKNSIHNQVCEAIMCGDNECRLRALKAVRANWHNITCVDVDEHTPLLSTWYQNVRLGISKTWLEHTICSEFEVRGKISAIKLFRKITEASLMDAKEAVEYIWYTYNKEEES